MYGTQRIAARLPPAGPGATTSRRGMKWLSLAMAVVWPLDLFSDSALLRANHIGGLRDPSTDSTLRTRARQCNSRGVNLIRTQRSGARLAKTQVADQIATIGSACTAEPVDLTLAPLPQANSGIRIHSMRRMTIVAIATMLTTASAFGQNAGTAGPGSAPLTAKPLTAPPTGATNPALHTAAVKPAAASTPESRSAAALALSHEPTFDEGTAQRIRDAALSYSDLAVRGGWPAIPSDAKFAIGVPGPHDDLLRQRLLISGDLAVDKASGAFDEVVAEAVMRFQARHGLAPTGTVTPRTLAALNVPVQKRIKQLEASLERLENMNFGFGQRYVVVNLPATFAEAVENDHVVRRYRVIVGKTEKPSPTLTAEITGVILNPTWTVPSSISKTEISAHMRKDPGYLARMHMEVLDAHDVPIDPRSVDWSGARTPNFTVRQQSGTFNALGAVKIDMPNPYSVYSTTPTSETCSATITASTRTAARGSTMCAILPPGCCRKRCRNGIGLPSTRPSPPASTRTSCCRRRFRWPGSTSRGG